MYKRNELNYSRGFRFEKERTIPPKVSTHYFLTPLWGGHSLYESTLNGILGQFTRASMHSHANQHNKWCTAKFQNFERWSLARERKRWSPKP